MARNIARNMARYRCVDPDTICNPARGGPKNEIQAGASFEDLSVGSTGPVWGAYTRVGETAFVFGD
jgi:rubredoxin